MMIEAIPRIIIETSSRINDRQPRANNHPKRMEMPIRNNERRERNEYSSRARIKMTAIAMDHALSILICRAFVTAMTGAPDKWISMPEICDSVCAAASLSRAMSRELLFVSFDP